MKRSGIALLLLALASASLAADEPQVSPTPPESKGALQFQKLDWGLNRILESDDAEATAESLGYRVREGRIQVVIQVVEGTTPEVEVWLKERGSLFVVVVGDLVQAFVPTKHLRELNDNPRVLYVRRPLYREPEPDSAQAEPLKIEALTEGLQAMNGAAWHSQGFRGQGVSVAVIDGGFEGMDALVGTELPPAGQLVMLTFGGTPFYGADHGTACAEVVFDVVPEIETMYLFATNTEVDIAQAVTEASNRDADVISMSLGALYWGPGDGTGVIASALNAFTAAGGVAVVSAGNQRLSHWQGTWDDPDSNGYLNFATGLNENFLTSDGTNMMWFGPLTRISAQLVWNQWSAPATDLDLCIVGWDGANVFDWACSRNVQNGQAGRIPVEVASDVSILGGYYGVRVEYWGGPTNVQIELVMRPDMQLEDNVPEGSVMVPSDTESVIGVAALDAGAPYPLEPYSGKGPTNGPGGALNGGRVKPDLSGYANVSTVTYGARGGASQFNGTSAACPHVAGAAALVWSAYPTWSATQVRNYLQTNADDMGPGGKDNDYGYGRLWLGDPPSSCTYNISPTSASYGASGGSSSFSVSTQAGCTWTAVSNNGWIHITSGASGTGSGTVSYSVDANGSSSSRTGTITAAGRTFTITQSGSSGCSYTISPTSQSFGPSGGSSSVSVNTTAGCSWTASSNNGWIHVTSGSSGTGSGTVNYSVDANAGGSRSGTMTIAGETFTVTQSGSGGGGPYYYQVAGIAHAGGAGGSVWRSTLCVTNRAGSTADLTLVYRMGSNSVTRTHMLQNGRIKEWADVAVSLFNQSGNTSGAIEITSSVPVMVVARTYNEAPEGTFGQGMPGNDDSATLAYGQMGVLPQLKKTSAFRTNVGLMNHGSAACNVRIKLYSETGSQIGNTIDTSVPAKQWKQINDVFDEAGVANCSIGYATIEVRTAGGKVWAYGSVVDNGTGDPTTISLFIE